ncbi:MAG: neutral/alkaline non-lysosomal ceramidase N-terminal domain-containing protein [Bryobacteraceae bacterium]
MRLQLLVLLSLAASGTACAAWQAGAAAVDITPSESIWLAGYGARTKPSESIRQRIFAKALALKDDAGAVSVVVTLDLVGIKRDMSEAIAKRAAAELHIPRERILFNASHTHSAPVVGDFSTYADMMGSQLNTQKEVIRRYTLKLPSDIYGVIAKSVAALEPATLDFEQGYAGFAVNRRRVGHREYPGPVDHDVPVLAVKNGSRKVVAILFGYACHNTVMGDYTVHGDYAGYAQHYLQQRFPGAVAMFVQGAGADSNPLPRRKPEHLERYGATLADAVDEVMRGNMKPVTGAITAAIEFPEVMFEGPFDRERWTKEIASKDERLKSHGTRMLALSGTGKLPHSRPYAVEAWRFGSTFTLIALAGELTVDYAVKFKSLYGHDTTWVAGYSNDVFGYIPSLRVWREGGYEGGEAFRFSNFPGRLMPDVEGRITASVERLITKVRGK